MPLRFRLLVLSAVLLGALPTALGIRGLFELGPKPTEKSWHLWPPKYVGARSFLAMGDSYTIGEGVGIERGWPMQLAARLRTAGTDLSDPHILAKTGWTAQALRAHIDGALPKEDGRTFDLVTLLIGVNDQYSRRAVLDFRREFDGLLERALRLARGRRERVVVISLPDWGVGPFAAAQPAQPKIASEIDAFNEVVADLCRSRDIVLVDVTAISRRSDAQLCADGLHPSVAQYEEWARQIEPACAAALAR